MAVSARGDGAVATLVLCALLATAFAYNWPEPTLQNLNFGWEYGNTAASLASGEGFENPFEGVRSGPTAWMPPAYVALMAGVFSLFGVKTLSALWVLLVLKYAGIALSLFLLLRAAAVFHGRQRWLLVPAFALSLCANRATFFWSLHDTWVVLLGSTVIVYDFVVRSVAPSRRNDFGSLALAGLLPLTSPPVAAAYALLRVLESMRDWRSRSTRAPAGALSVGARLGLSMAMLLLSTTVWAARNHEALGMFIPVKSNLWFDFYQANHLDDDGLVSNATFLAFNPSNPNRFQEHYEAVGEAAFTKEFAGAASRMLRRDPGEVMRRAGRRAFSALVYLHDPDDVRPATAEEFTPADIERLLDADLLGIDWLGQEVWLSLGMAPDQLGARLASLGLDREQTVARDWERGRSRIEEQRSHWSIVGRSLILSAGPTFCLLFGLLRNRSRRDPLFASAAMAYLAILLPYVIVSHYLRYQVPLIGLQAVFWLHAGRALLEGSGLGSMSTVDRDR